MLVIWPYSVSFQILKLYLKYDFNAVLKLDIDINECNSSPCKNGGSCVDMYNDFRCICKSPGFDKTCEKCKPGKMGDLCDIDRPNTCLSSPCKHGATCKHNAEFYNYTCTCTQGFTGSNCETKINECAR